MPVRVAVLPSAAEVGRHAAGVVAGHLERGALRVLGVATGSSPSPLYAALGRMRLRGWDAVTAVALDEYVGLPPEHPQSYASVVDREVRAELGLDPRRVHVPDGTAADLDAECARYEGLLADSGGVDLQVLGIGRTGHIGFNEPGSPLDSRTRVVELTEPTRADNARFFPSPEDVPRRAVTQGIATIAGARRHLLIARGARKAPAVRAALEGPVTTACPASVLQLLGDVTVVLDVEAASALTTGGPARETP